MSDAPTLPTTVTDGQAAQSRAAFDPSRYVHVAQSDLVTDLRTGLTLTPAALCRRLDGIQPDECSIQAYLFAGNHGITKVDAYTYAPGQPLIVSRDGARYLNRWTPSDVTPVEGDVTPFLDHVDYLFDGEEAVIKHVLNWLAHLVQHPARKQSNAILITSEAEGIGKGVFGKMAAAVVGTANTRYLSAEAITSDFNDWLVTSSLVIVEEFEDTGRRGGMARLKNYVTDETADVNPKHAARYRAPNMAHFLLFANASTPLKLTEADRRFVVHRSEAQPREAGYYANLMRWFEDDGRSHVLHHLLHRDLSAYNPHGRAPLTASHRALVTQSRDPQTAYLHHALEAAEPPFTGDLVVVKHVVDHVNSVGRVRLTTRLVEDFLREIRALRLSRQYRLIADHPGRNYLWVIRRPEDGQGDVPVERVREAYVHPDDQAAQLFGLTNQPASLAIALQPQRRPAPEPR